MINFGKVVWVLACFYLYSIIGAIIANHFQTVFFNIILKLVFASSIGLLGFLWSVAMMKSEESNHRGRRR